MIHYELRQYSFGETIGKGFNLYLNNFGPLVLMSLLCRAAEFMMDQITRYSALTHPTEIGDIIQFWSLAGLFFLVFSLTSTLSTGYTVYIVSRKFINGEADTIDTEGAFKTKIIPLMRLSLLVYLYLVLWMLLLVIPGIIAILRYSMSIMVAVLENTGAVAAIDRSKTLTDNRKWYIFGCLMVANVFAIGSDQLVVSWLAKTFIRDPTLICAIRYALSGFTAPIYACILTVVYFNLRIEKEGYNIEHLARQFSLAKKEYESPM